MLIGSNTYINGSHSVAGLLPTVTRCVMLNLNISLRLFSFWPTKHFDHDLDLILIDIELERCVYSLIFVHLFNARLDWLYCCCL